MWKEDQEQERRLVGSRSEAGGLGELKEVLAEPGGL